MRYPRLFAVGWTLFFAGVPFQGASSAGLLLLLAHWLLDREALRPTRAGEEPGPAQRAARTGRRGLPAARPRLHAPGLAAAALLVALALGAAGSADPRISALAALAVALPLAFGLFYVRRLQVRLGAIDPLWFVPMLWPLGLTAAAHAAWALWLYRATGERASTVLHPNGVGTMMMVSLGLGLAWFAGRRRLWWLAVPYVLLLIGGAIASGSRGSWIGIGALLVLASLAGLRTPSGRKAFVAAYSLLALLLAALAVTHPEIPRRVVAILADPGRNQGRVAIYQAAWAMFRDHPWLGVGPGLFGRYWNRYGGEWRAVEPDIAHAHNLVLQLLAETGLLGTAAFFALVAAVVASAWRARRVENYSLFWILFATFLAWLIRDQVDLTLAHVNNGFLFWSLGGVLLGLPESGGRGLPNGLPPASPAPGRPPDRPATGP